MTDDIEFPAPPREKFIVGFLDYDAEYTDDLLPYALKVVAEFETYEQALKLIKQAGYDNAGVRYLVYEYRAVAESPKAEVMVHEA